MDGWMDVHGRASRRIFLNHPTLWTGELIPSETQLSFASSAVRARRTQRRRALVVPFSLGNELISFLLQPISIPAKAAVVRMCIRRPKGSTSYLRTYVCPYVRLFALLQPSLCRDPSQLHVGTYAPCDPYLLTFHTYSYVLPFFAAAAQPWLFFFPLPWR